MVPVELTMFTMSFYTEVGNWLFISFGSELTVMCLRKTLKKKIQLLQNTCIKMLIEALLVIVPNVENSNTHQQK